MQRYDIFAILGAAGGHYFQTMDYDKIYYNSPIAILQQVRTDNRGNIQRKSVKFALSSFIGFALYGAYRKEMQPGCEPDDYDERVFLKVTGEMGLESLRVAPKEWVVWSMRIFGVYKDNRVIVGVDRDLLIGYLNNLDYKSNFEIIQLQAFLAIRSIIGVCCAKQIKWLFILSRMAGHEKAVKSVEALPDFIARYNSRRLRDKLIRALCDRWHMKYYGKNLGKGSPPWFSFDQDLDLEDHVSLIKVRKKRKTGVAAPSNPEPVEVEILDPRIFGNSTLW